MQYYMSLFFGGTNEELFQIIASYLENAGIDFRKKYETDGGITVVSDYFVIWIDIPEESDKRGFLWLKEDYGVTVNYDINFQLYPDGTNEMICDLVSYLLGNIDGDLYLTSEFDTDIIYRNHELHISPSWEKYFKNLAKE